MPDVSEGNIVPDPTDLIEPPVDDAPVAPPAGRARLVETAYARRAGSSADVDGTHHHAAAPGEGEGTGIGESGG